MQQWEYQAFVMVHQDDGWTTASGENPRLMVDIFEERGSQGWELVCLTPEHWFNEKPENFMGDHFGSRVHVYRAVFKRPRQ